jgi:hypothetical protein
MIVSTEEFLGFAVLICPSIMFYGVENEFGKMVRNVHAFYKPQDLDNAWAGFISAVLLWFLSGLLFRWLTVRR